ncbi:N-acetylmuramoyl-L-alanine amidase [Rubricella aquisinus]|uniref:N-acetylmuramoyl-L-alanine amidase n=1 Tax=Rubricella aquisinus TaxID=2028108 RepID=A0A840WKS2_9RHOB|nr:N-acetylmuramoyl-L-alanine amidase [Rubricella aquisinus]MBB5514763.1 N-acetylmuramoyl-L-alanine amidase [Rubricella aquisinus]
MTRWIIGIACLLCLCASHVLAAPLAGALTVETRGLFTRETVLEMPVDQPVPFRVFTVDRPDRVIVDFDGLVLPEVTGGGGVVSGLRAGWFTAGQSRLEITLARKARIVSAAMEDGQFRLILTETDAAEFAETLNPPEGWARLPTLTAEIAGDDGLPLVMLDPGHGGIDPGAVRDGISEKDIALTFGLELRDALLATGRYRVAMTREEDIYIGLRRRVDMARAAGADVFLSLHANTVTRGEARGAAVYSLSDDASDAATAALAALENQADLFVDVDLGAGDTEVARVLLDLARVETNARSGLLAGAMVETLRHSAGVIRTHPHRSAGFAVLKAPDIPSLLIELGFLSDAQDRLNMRSPIWRAKAIAGVIAGLDEWSERDRLMSGLTRQ